MLLPCTTESDGLAVIAISRFAPAVGEVIGAVIGITRLLLAESVDDSKLRAPESDALRLLAVSAIPSSQLLSAAERTILPVVPEEMAALEFGSNSASDDCIWQELTLAENENFPPALLLTEPERVPSWASFSARFPPIRLTTTVVSLPSTSLVRLLIVNVLG